MGLQDGGRNEGWLLGLVVGANRVTGEGALAPDGVRCIGMSDGTDGMSICPAVELHAPWCRSAPDTIPLPAPSCAVLTLIQLSKVFGRSNWRLLNRVIIVFNPSVSTSKCWWMALREVCMSVVCWWRLSICCCTWSTADCVRSSTCPIYLHCVSLFDCSLSMSCCISPNRMALASAIAVVLTSIAVIFA